MLQKIGIKSLLRGGVLSLYILLTIYLSNDIFAFTALLFPLFLLIFIRYHWYFILDIIIFFSFSQISIYYKYALTFDDALPGEKVTNSSFVGGIVAYEYGLIIVALVIVFIWQKAVQNN